MNNSLKLLCLFVLFSLFVATPGCWLHRSSDDQVWPASTGAIKLSAVADAGPGNSFAASLKAALKDEVMAAKAIKFQARIKFGAAMHRIFSVERSDSGQTLSLDATLDSLSAGKQQVTIEIVASGVENADPVLKTIATATVAPGQTNENDIKNAPINYETTARAIVFESLPDSSTKSIDDFSPPAESIQALATTIQNTLGGSIDGSKTLSDPTIKAEAEKVVEAVSNPQPAVVTLAAISLSAPSGTVAANATFDLAGIVVTATYSDNSTKTVTGHSWSIKSGGGSIAGTVFTPPAAAGEVVLTCSYAENEIIRTADFAVTVLPAAGSGSLSGTIRDAVTQAPLAGVSVRVLDAMGNAVQSVVSDAGGNYLLNLSAGSGYRVVFSKEGYLEANYENVVIEIDVTRILENIMQIDTQHAGTGNVGGIVSEATTGNGLPNVTISLRQGVNALAGNIEATTTTDSSGNYHIDGLAAGLYTAEAVCPNYITGHFTITVIGGMTTGNQNVSISPSMLTGEGFRVQLTWGASPEDLDSYLSGPGNDGERFYVTCGGDYYYNNELMVEHDVDDVTSYGPETITVLRQLTGTYRYLVKNFSQEAEMSTSGAKVTLYQGDQVKAVFNVPNSSGRWWTVFDLNGSTLTPINTMSDNYSLHP